MRARVDPWAGALEEYFTAMRAAQRAPGTIRLHRHYLSRLRELHPRTPWRITTKQLQAFLGGPEWKPETRKSARGVLCGFFRWGHGVGYIEEDPASYLATVRVPAGVPRPTPEHVVKQLLRDRDPRIGLMGMLMAYAGLRASEVAGLHTNHFTGEELIITGKGGKTRSIPVTSDRLRSALLACPEGWVFPNGLGSHLSPGHVSKLMSHALPFDWTGHTLRHRMASVAYEHTRDLLAISAILGHARLETTQRYTKMPDNALRAAIAAASGE